MMTRREWLGTMLGAGTGLAIDPAALLALVQQPLLTRAIPSTGEVLPLVGLGSSATFSRIARSEDVSALREVLTAMDERGGRVFDTAPGYGASEEVAGVIARELGITDQIFWATKVDVARDETVDPAAVRAQIETSFRRIGKRPIDLIQVHDLGDVANRLPILASMKAEGRIRYIGASTTDETRYDELAEIMRNEPLDFVGVDYAVDNRMAENTILPLALERGIGVLSYVPFGRTRLWNRVAGVDLPEWARDFDATTWAQFFIKFVAAHPAVTVVTPATSQARNMIDNLGGAVGRLPDEATRQRMIEVVDALPSAT